jgi:hypothetical protein
LPADFSIRLGSAALFANRNAVFYKGKNVMSTDNIYYLEMTIQRVQGIKIRLHMEGIKIRLHI